MHKEVDLLDNIHLTRLTMVLLVIEHLMRHCYMGLSRVLEGTLKENIESVYSLESKLFFVSICSIVILSRNWDKPQNPIWIDKCTRCAKVRWYNSRRLNDGLFWVVITLNKWRPYDIVGIDRNTELFQKVIYIRFGSFFALFQGWAICDFWKPRFCGNFYNVESSNGTYIEDL